jgi:hypothetical protein
MQDCFSFIQSISTMGTVNGVLIKQYLKWEEFNTTGDADIQSQRQNDPFRLMDFLITELHKKILDPRAWIIKKVNEVLATPGAVWSILAIAQKTRRGKSTEDGISNSEILYPQRRFFILNYLL